MARNNNNNNYVDGNPDRPWSDDQGYLDTMAGLINRSHEAATDADQDVYDWFFILEQLQLEIIGQLVVRQMNDELEELNALRLETSNKLDKAYEKIGDKVGYLSQADASKLRRIVYPYNEFINILIHKMDLRLHEVKPFVPKLAVEDDY